MKKLVLRSPAKVNLYLEVLRKRHDGYHDIETLFEKVALFDIITIAAAKSGIRITTDNPRLPHGRTNLAYKAAKALFEKAAFRGGVAIHVKKNIPVAAGLGGGSSDAAAVLKGANSLFRLGLKKTDLMALGSGLGADVPFFLDDSSFAVGTSRGDKIRPIYINNINIWHIIVYFDFEVSTKWVYGRLNLKLTRRINDVKIPVRLLRSLLRENNSVENLGNSLYNRLEEVVFNRFNGPAVAKAALLNEGACGAVMSGSGPTVFGIVGSREEGIAVGRRLQQRLSRYGARVLVAGTTKGA
jgi:4-diphosphocytidyl-2-C-methyl-D-erythritol kinase